MSKDAINRLFPKQADNEFKGAKIIVSVSFIIVIFTIARSLIHIFAPDGRAFSIAGIDMSIAGGAK